jgi:molybdate transport system ATP-binding protein
MMIKIDIRTQRGEFSLRAQCTAPTPGVTALFGPSGGGKSTLVRVLCGLERASGTVALDEHVWLDSGRQVDVAPEHRRIGCVFQDPRLFPHLDVTGNLDYAERRARRREKYVAFDEVVTLLGLGSLLHRRVQELSGGERSRVAIARALLSQPRLLVLDEPFASLDANRRDEILPFLERLRDRYAVPMIYVSHQYEEVLRLASHVLLIEAGTIVASGSPAALSFDPALRRLVGNERAGAVIEGRVLTFDPARGLATVSLGHGELRLPADGLEPGGRARVLVPARDVLLALGVQSGLSVRNQLAGTIVEVVADPPGAALVVVDVGGQSLIARITRQAIDELNLAPGRSVHALVKAESLRGHAYPGGSG